MYINLYKHIYHNKAYLPKGVTEFAQKGIIPNDQSTRGRSFLDQGANGLSYTTIDKRTRQERDWIK